MLELPEARNTDPADVAWALGTACALWRRHDRVEAVIWLRRAAENAADLGLDKRATEIAKAAADARELLLDDTSQDALDLARTLDLSEHELPTVERMVAAEVWDDGAADEASEEYDEAIEELAGDPYGEVDDEPTSTDGDSQARRIRAGLIAAARELAPTIDPEVFEAFAGLGENEGGAQLHTDDAITVTY